MCEALQLYLSPKYNIRLYHDIGHNIVTRKSPKIVLRTDFSLDFLSSYIEACYRLQFKISSMQILHLILLQIASKMEFTKLGWLGHMLSCLDTTSLFQGKNYFCRKTQKSLFVPYIWYGKAIFLLKKGHVSSWPRILVWPN